MNELALFAGAGGGILGGKLLGWRTVCAVERDEYASSVLVQRQNDGHLEPFPVWSDVRTFDGKPWRGRIDVVSGGFPCQDISSAGNCTGIKGKRSGLWVEMARIISEVRPRFVFVENSPLLTSRGLGTVLGDLAEMGYDAEWGVLGAHHAGAPHKRDRIWVVGENVADAVRVRQQGPWEPEHSSNPEEDTERETNHAQHVRRPQFWSVEPPLGRVAYGVARRMDKLKAIGNGQVPVVAATAFEILRERLEQKQ